jgi:acetyltransferase-like isoleucine patch superfamily enzyme
MMQLRQRVRAAYRPTVWRRQLDGRLTIGPNTRLAGATVVVRDRAGCRLAIGAESDVSAAMVFEAADAQITIGSRTHVGGGTLLDAAVGITIGDDVLIAFGALIMDHDSHSLDFEQRRHDVTEWVQGRKDWTHVSRASVRVDDKVWVGTRAIILKGVHLGEGCVVAAGSVVTRDVPAWTLVAGSPARVIRDLTTTAAKK